MNWPLIVMWGVGGWCGTRWPGWWRGPRPPQPDPEPWLTVQIIGIVAGVIGGWIVNQMIGPGPELAGRIAATTIGSVLASRLVTDIYRLAGGSRAQG